MYIHYHMTPEPISMHLEQTVAEAIDLLQRHSFRHVPVVDDEGVLKGIISDRDLRSARPSSVARSKERRFVEERVNNTPLSQLMTPDCLTLSPMATLDDALLLFQTRKIGALPVLDRIACMQSEMSLIPLYQGMPDFSQALDAYRAEGFVVAGFFPITRNAALALNEVDCTFVRQSVPTDPSGP